MKDRITCPIKLALFGEAGSGKDYVTEKLIREIRLGDDCLMTTCKRYAFADKLKDIVNNLLGFNDERNVLSKTSEDFKRRYFIDLDTLDSMWLSEVPENTTCTSDFMHKDHVLLKDNRVRGWFVVYTAEELFRLFSRAQSGREHSIIPNMVQCWDFEAIKYPEGYNKEHDTYRRLMSYREYIVWVGTYCFQNLIGKNTWVNAMFNDPDFKENTTTDWHGAIITDIRFPHEYEACKKLGFKIIKIEAEKKEAEVSNIAEQHYSKFDPDFVFYNSRDSKKFRGEMRRCINYIKDEFTR